MNKLLHNMKSEGQMVPLSLQSLRGAHHRPQTAQPEAFDTSVGQPLISLRVPGPLQLRARSKHCGSSTAAAAPTLSFAHWRWGRARGSLVTHTNYVVKRGAGAGCGERPGSLCKAEDGRGLRHSGVSPCYGELWHDGAGKSIVHQWMEPP